MITNRSSDRQQQRLRALAAQWIIILQIFNSGNQYGHFNCMCCTYVCMNMNVPAHIHSYTFVLVHFQFSCSGNCCSCSSSSMLPLFFCRLHCWEWHCWGQSTNSVLYVCVSRPYSLTHTYAHMHMQYIACACACLFFFETTLNGSQPSLHTRTHTHVNTY